MDRSRSGRPHASCQGPSFSRSGTTKHAWQLGPLAGRSTSSADFPGALLKPGHACHGDRNESKACRLTLTVIQWQYLILTRFPLANGAG